MHMDFTDFFQQYEKLAKESEQAFVKIRRAYPEEVKCKIGCTDCCYALFDLSLIEAMYLNYQFKNYLANEKQKEILEKANFADRQAYKIKRRIYHERQKGLETNKLLEEAGRERVRCPLLGNDDQCELYAFRPVTCRLYGVPTKVGQSTHSCGLSGFEPGVKYPAVFMDKIQDRLLKISSELVGSIPTEKIKLAEVLVPVSMALLTEYDHEYLGIIPQEQRPEQAQEANKWVLGPQDRD